ncbi:MAG: hypothetical protein CMH54_05420 [Myxococcales bacterium]|mgnify:CR=1 FL=1|nr:hypothetical protein [Myxococcales bacterium]
MVLVVHGSNEFRTALKVAFDDRPALHICAADEIPTGSRIVMRIAEAIDDLPARETDIPHVVIGQAGSDTSVMYCLPDPTNGVPSGLRNLIALLDETTTSISVWETIGERLEEYVSVVHHDLSEPARNMSFFAEFLKTKRVTDEESVEDFLSRIHVSGERLQRLLKDITRYARVWLRPVEMEQLEADDIIMIVGEAFELAQTRANNFEQQLSVEGSCRLDVPRRFLQTILVELLANAIEFHPEGGETIRLRFAPSQEPGYIDLRVEDDGPGLVAPSGGRLFRPFYRGSRDNELRTGIGLALVRAMAERAGGVAETEPKSDDERALVVVRLKGHET